MSEMPDGWSLDVDGEKVVVNFPVEGDYGHRVLSGHQARVVRTQATRPDQSMLLFKDEEPADMDWRASLNARTSDRRLLVLNVCSGGRSTMHGSPYGFGIAPALAGPSQTVISHLWPTTPAVAAAFGVTLADALARGADHVHAFTSALKALSAV